MVAPGRPGRRSQRTEEGHAPGRADAVLLVEDGALASATLARALRAKGFSAERVRGADEGVAAAHRGPYDLVLLALTEDSGVDACRAIRAQATVPVIVVSPVDDEAERVAALEAGADDCVRSPFTAREVVARVDAVLRRTCGRARRDLVLQDIEIRVAEHDVVVAGRHVELTAREFEVLRYLAERAGQVVTRQRLLADVWGMEFPGGTRTVDVHIAQLRRKLGRPGAIRTVRGVGYKALHFPGQAERSDGRPAEAAAG
ncbi:MAG: response regulator transcription factor [Thermoleophilia bacterium]|nr:response regulator transcription factor [Thermoleophilia bacterium]